MQKYLTPVQRDKQDYCEQISLVEGAEVELHTVAGHVIVGQIINVVWDIHDELVSAVVMNTTSPSPTATDENATITYERIVMMDHVFEIRPRYPR